jgi:hypothetical protein
MYGNLNHALIRALEAERRAAVERSAARPARAAPMAAAVRRSLGRALVRAGTRLAPEAGAASAPVVGSPC